MWNFFELFVDCISFSSMNYDKFGDRTFSLVSFLLTVKNGCFYKGALYNQGENWQDGCDFNCTCEDATTGQYFCIDQSVHFDFVVTFFSLHLPCLTTMGGQ